MKITIRLIVIIIVVVVALAVAIVASKQPAPVTDTFFVFRAGVCSRELPLYFGDGFKAVQSAHSTCFIFVLEFLTCYKTLLFVF